MVGNMDIRDEYCNESHEPIIYLGNDCPLCEAIREIDSLKKELEKLKKLNRRQN